MTNHFLAHDSVSCKFEISSGFVVSSDSRNGFVQTCIEHIVSSALRKSFWGLMSQSLGRRRGEKGTFGGVKVQSEQLPD